jgi:hypothetical protein
MKMKKKKLELEQKIPVAKTTKKIRSEILRAMQAGSI